MIRRIRKQNEVSHHRDLFHLLLVPFLGHYQACHQSPNLTVHRGRQQDHGGLEEPTATTKHKGHELWRHHSPAASVGKGLHTSVTPTTPRSRPLDECLRTRGLFSFQFKSRASITLSYITLVSYTTPVNKEILFPKCVWVILNCPLSLSMVRFYGSAADRATWQYIYGIQAVCESFYKSWKRDPCLKWFLRISTIFHKARWMAVSIPFNRDRWGQFIKPIKL